MRYALVIQRYGPCELPETHELGDIDLQAAIHRYDNAVFHLQATGGGYISLLEGYNQPAIRATRLGLPGKIQTTEMPVWYLPVRLSGGVPLYLARAAHAFGAELVSVNRAAYETLPEEVVYDALLPVTYYLFRIPAPTEAAAQQKYESIEVYAITLSLPHGEHTCPTH